MKKLLSLFTALVLMGGMMTLQAATYTVAGGSEELFGTSWTPGNEANDMTLENGLYTWSKENVTLSDNVEFKVVQDHSWDINWPAQNYVLSITQTAVYTVSITFNAASKAITATATKTGEAGPVSATYTVAGDDTSVFGTEWTQTDENNDMVLEGTLYKWEKQVVKTASTVNFKVCKNHGWGNSWPSANYPFTFPKWGEFIFTITFDPDTKDVNAYCVEKFYTVTGSSAALFGNEWITDDADNDMILLSDSITYTKSYTNIELAVGDISYKVAADHDWDQTGQFPMEGNQTLKILEAGKYDVTFTYVPSVPSLTAEATLIPENPDPGQDPGQNPGQDPDPAQVTWTVAGDNGDVFGTTWDAANAANDMTLDNGLYTWSKEDVTLGVGSLLFKVCKNHDWAEAYPSANYELSIPEDGIYDISITFNEDSKEVNATATKKGSAVVIPTIAMHGNFLGSWANTANFEIAEGNEKASLTLNITSTGIKSFGMRIGGSGNWTSNGSQFTRNDSIKVIVSGSGDCSLDVDVAGDYVFTWTYATNTLTVTYPEIPEPDAFVAGSSAEIFGAEWDGSAAANKMTWDEGLSKYTKTYTVDKAYKSVALKVVYDGVWYGVGGGTTDNVKFSLSGAGEFTVLFDKTTHFVTLDGAIVGEEQFDFAHVAVAGNGSTGSNWLNGENWNAAAEANRMNEVATDIYEISFSDVEGVQCQFQFTFDDAWIYQFGGTFSNFGSETAAVYGNGGGNITFTPVAGAKITIRLDLSNFNFATKQGATFTVSQVEPAPTFVTVRTGLEIGRYYTVCLEKNVVEMQGATFWSLTYRNEGGTMAYIEEEAVPFAAGKPFIFQATADKLDVLYGDETAAEPVENGALRGTFEYMSIADVDALPGNPYLLIQNALRPRLSTQNSLGAHRAYVEYNALSVGAPVSAPGRRVRSMPMQPNTATGFDEISQEPKANSQKLLINGELFILRGEKLYDATGRLVK